MAPAAISQLNLTGLCGTISYDVEGGSKEVVNRYRSVKLAGLQGMISTLQPVAKRLVDQLHAPSGSKSLLDPLNPKPPLITNSDGEPVGFLKSKTAPISYDRDNQVVTDLRKALSEGGQIPSVNWPLGAAEMLSAAANYQRLLAAPQAGGVVASQATAEAVFDAAKQQGWIAAGGYYRLLAAIQNKVKLEYGSYRLNGYSATGAPFKDPKSLSNRDVHSPTYNDLFPAATDPVNGSIGKLDQSYQEALGNALTWIELSIPYAQLLGISMTPAINLINTGAGIKMPTFSNMPDQLSMQVSLISGAVLIAIPFTQTIAMVLLAPLPMNYLKFDVNEVFNTWDINMNNSPGLDPILKLQNLGQSMMVNSLLYINQLLNFFSTITTALTISGTVYQAVSIGVAACSFWGVCAGVSAAVETSINVMNGLIEMVQTVIFMNIPIGLAVITPMLVSGIMFSIYVPLIPYLLFLFGVISWFISVLVLMASAPIICFLMLWGNSSQENPLLAREAEQFIMQIVGVFFRPTLMIIGLITGMVLSYIGVDVLNLGFAGIAKSLIPDAAGGKEWTEANMIAQVGIMLVYTFTMVSLVNMCFSTIYLLYSEVMRVAGIQAPAVGAEAQQLESIKGSTTQMAEAGAGGMKEGSTAGKGAGYKVHGTNMGKHDFKKDKEKEKARAKGKN